jgi:hypothetical protein
MIGASKAMREATMLNSVEWLGNRVSSLTPAQ